jgi:cell division protein FtsB
MKYTKILIIAPLIAVVALMGWGGWNLERTINYKWSYQDSVRKTVREEIKSLQDRIIVLEREVSNLKTNR